jgi:mono/diheme cytochrome c family protein
MTQARKARALLFAALTATALAACGGGAQTTDNPLPQNPGGPSIVTYNGVNGPRDADVNAFLQSFWTPMQNSATCGNCHVENGTGPTPFARFDDINMAYDAAVTKVDMGVPGLSELVSKVSSGHNCWLADANACGDIMTTWIENWAGATSGGGGRQIVLTPPPSADPGESKSYANADVENFRTTVYPLLTQNCAGCHSSGAPTAQSPYFAETGAADSYLAAYEAAKPKMDLDDPGASRFVVRLDPEFHNCWTTNCVSDSDIMESAISGFAATVPLTQIDQALVNSKALRLVDGTVASGGNRYESAQIALYEFKTGSGTTAYDTSGVAPALDLTLSGEYEWFGGWGVTISSGRAQGSTSASRKLHDRIRVTGEYSIEAWAVPANVTQEMSRIVTYSGGENARNFTLQQTLYNYDFLNRTTVTGANGDQPTLSTPDAAEVLQATLQHVVATYSAIDGRRIYVNGELVTPNGDPAAQGTLTDWDDTFALVLGNEAGGDGLWQGTLRMVAVHEFALTPEQVQQNFDVGVGEKFFLLFSIEDIINVPTAYILFEVAQFDNYAYLFAKPHFVTLDPAQTVEGVQIQGLRIGINGAEVDKSQSYANMDDMLSTSLFGPLGQPLSTLGAVIPLEKGPSDDEFFLTFDQLGTQSYVRTGDPPLVITATDALVPAERIGVRTFDEINATFATVTGVDPEDTAVDMTFQNLRQSLPATEDPKSFLSSHQVAIAQLAFEYCNALMEDRGTISTAAMFPNFNFGAAPVTAYANRDDLITPLVDRVMGFAIQSQPDFTDVEAELGLVSFNAATGRPENLIDRMLAPAEPGEPQATTRGIAKGVCGAILGSAVTLIQ